MSWPLQLAAWFSVGMMAWSGVSLLLWVREQKRPPTTGGRHRRGYDGV